MTASAQDGVEVWRRDDLAAGRQPPAFGAQDESGASLYDLWVVGHLPEHLAATYVHIGEGNRTGPHAHSVSDHYTCVVDGKALLWVEGNDMVALDTGDCYRVAAGHIHELGAAP